MKNVLKCLFVVFLLQIIIVSCNPSSPTQPVPTQIQILSSHAWKLNAITSRDYAGGIEDVSIFKDCMQDDSLLLSLSGIYNMNNGSAICDSSDVHYSKGYWGYNLNYDSIQLISQVPDTVYRSWKVLTLNDSVLKVIYVDSISADNKLIKTMSFNK